MRWPYPVTGKKGDIAGYVMRLIPLLFVLTIIGVSLFVLMNKQINQSIESFPIESEVFFQRILYAKGAISYEDPATGRIVPGVIDYDRWKDNPEELETMLEKEIAFDHPLSARMILNGTALDSLSLHYHKTAFQRAKKFHDARIRGIGSAYFHEKSIPVIIKTERGVEQGLLTIEIALPKSS